MSAIVRQIIDNDNNQIYPVTKANAVYMERHGLTVQDEINELVGLDEDITFQDNGDILREIDNGNTVNISFVGNVITQVTKNEDGEVLRTQTITIDGKKITKRIVEGDN